MKKNHFLRAFIFICVLGISLPAFGHRRHQMGPPSPEQDKQIQRAMAQDGLDPADKTKVPLNKVKLINLLPLENATREYLLYFQAFLAARDSVNPAVRSKSPEFMRLYRDAYSRALKLMRESNLIHPLMPKDPKGWYGKKFEEEKGESAEWVQPVFQGNSKEVQDMVKGGGSPEQVQDFVQGVLPSKREIQPKPSTTSSSGTPSSLDGEKALPQKVNDGAPPPPPADD